MIQHIFDPFRTGRGWDDLDGNGEALTEAPAGPMRQFVSFSVGSSTFAVDILAIREFKRWTETTALPNTPPYVRGVINLRGVVVPVYDLRARFGHGATEPTNTHVIMMVSVAMAKDTPADAEGPAERIVGLLVDAVDDVLSISVDAISAVPETDTSAHPFVQGVLTVGEKMIAVLNLDRLLSHEDLPGLPV